MKQIPRLLALMPLLIVLGCAHSSRAGEVTVSELHQALQSDSELVLVDVRTPDEWQAQRADRITNFVEYDQIGERHAEIGIDFETPVYLICRSGRRSGIAAETMYDQGYKHVFNVVGGTNAWVESGYPVLSGPVSN